MAKSDDINQRVEEKTTFGAYILKNLKINVMLFGGMALGAGAGFLAMRSEGLVKSVRSGTKWILETALKNKDPKKAKEVNEFIKEVVDSKHLSLVLPGAGALVGTFIGTVPNTYEHWKNSKRAQYQTEEMADDVIKLREERNLAMAELRKQSASLERQNKAIEDILAKGPNSNKPPAVKPLPAEQAERLKTDPSHGKGESSRGKTWD